MALNVKYKTIKLFCAGLSLSIVTLSAKNAWKHSPGPPHFPFSNQCCGCTTPYDSYYDYKVLSIITIRKLRKNTTTTKNKGKRFITHKPWSYMACLGPHSEVVGRKKKERMWAWGSAFAGAEGGMVWVLQVHSLWVNLKHKGRN